MLYFLKCWPSLPFKLVCFEKFDICIVQNFSILFSPILSKPTTWSMLFIFWT